MNNYLMTRPVFLRIVDSNGSTHVEERQTWGEDGPAKVHESVAAQYHNEWQKQADDAKSANRPPPRRPVVSVIDKAEYDGARFGRRAA